MTNKKHRFLYTYLTSFYIILALFSDDFQLCCFTQFSIRFWINSGTIPDPRNHFGALAYTACYFSSLRLFRKVTKTYRKLSLNTLPNSLKNKPNHCIDVSLCLFFFNNQNHYIDVSLCLFAWTQPKPLHRCESVSSEAFGDYGKERSLSQNGLWVKTARALAIVSKSFKRHGLTSI